MTLIVFTKFFGKKDHPEAGVKIFEWLESRGNLVVGGKLRDELGRNDNFARWYQEAILAGSENFTDIEDFKVNRQTQILQDNESYQSDDEHIIALAQISKARMLFPKTEK